MKKRVIASLLVSLLICQNIIFANGDMGIGELNDESTLEISDEIDKESIEQIEQSETSIEESLLEDNLDVYNEEISGVIDKNTEEAVENNQKSTNEEDIEKEEVTSDTSEENNKQLEDTKVDTEDTVASEKEYELNDEDTATEDTKKTLEEVEQLENIEETIIDDTVELIDDYTGIKVSGEIPDNAELLTYQVNIDDIEDIVKQVAPDAITGKSMCVAYDIEVLADDEKWYPEDTVNVQIPLNEMPSDVEVRVHHIVSNGHSNLDLRGEASSEHIDIEYETFTSKNGTLEVYTNEVIFDTTGFSIYIVEAYNSSININNTVTNGSTVMMERDEEKYFVWQINPGEDINDSTRGTWTVVSGEENIRIEVYNSNTLNDTYKISHRFAFWWLKVWALEPGTAQLKYTYLDSDKNFKNEYFNIIINETQAEVYIKDDTAETGCLKPVFVDGRELDDYTFEWTRSDGLPVISAALEEPYTDGIGSINISIDRGGVNQIDLQVKTYYLTVKDSGGNIIGQADYEVFYGNEIINGGFEYPVLTMNNGGFANGAEGVFWKTTAPAGEVAGSFAWDIEYISNAFGNDSINSFIDTMGIVKPAVAGQTPNGTRGSVTADLILPDGGKQCAEINASNPGALYQDILTYPDAEMYWSVYHRARNYSAGRADHNYWNTSMRDEMYVIIAPTADVKHIKTQAQLNELIAAAGSNVDGERITRTINGKTISYSIRKISSGHTHWTEYNNNNTPYVVGETEYLTRYFFASGVTYYDTLYNDDNTGTVGNIIDAVTFSNTMHYRIEYYKDGELLDELTEQFEVELNRGDWEISVDTEAGNRTAWQLDDTTCVERRFNGRTYPIGYVFDYVSSGHNVMQLYYESYGVVITKEIEVSNEDNLNNEEKEELRKMLMNYRTTYRLMSGSEEVATAVLTVDPDTKIGTATFLGTNGLKFKPDKDITYRIIEDGVGDVGELVLMQQTGNTGHIGGELVLTHSAIDTYKMIQYRDLIIRKQAEPGDMALDTNSSFVFHIVGISEDTLGIDLKIMLNGNSEKIIKNIPLGEYEITEESKWSWRYNIDSVEAEQGEVYAGGISNTWGIALDINGNNIIFDNKRSAIYWIDNSSFKAWKF